MNPSKVRKKIGNENVFGDFYHLFSDIGTHPTFNMMRMRCKTLKRKVEGRPQLYISVGGTPKTKEAYFCHVFIALVILQILSSVTVSFNKYLNMKEAEALHRGLLVDVKDMIIDMLVKPLNDSKSAEKIEATISALLGDLERVFNQSL